MERLKMGDKKASKSFNDRLQNQLTLHKFNHVSQIEQTLFSRNKTRLKICL